MESTITKIDWWQPIVYVSSYAWCSYVVYPEPHKMKSAAWGGEYKWKSDNAVMISFGEGEPRLWYDSFHYWKPATFAPFKGPDFWEMP